MKLFAGRSLRRVVLSLAVATLGMSAVAGTHVYFKSKVVNIVEMADLLPIDNIHQGYFVLQYNQTISADDRALLETNGLKVHRYLPDDAYLVSGLGEVVKKISENSDRVRGAFSYQPQFKLSSALGQPSVFNEHQVVRVIATVVSESDVGSVHISLVKNSKVSVKESSGRTFLLEMELGQLGQVAAIEGVEWMEPFQEMETMVLPLNAEELSDTMAGDFKDLTGFETGTKIMNFDTAWSRGYTGKGEIVAVADTGLDQGEVSKLAVDFQNTVGGAIFGLFAKDWSDPMGHGTHVSGSVMSSGAVSGGHFKGGAYGAKVFAEGMWSPMLKNLTVPSKLADLFEAARNAGARVQTNSWGSRTKGVYDGMSAQVDEYMWNHPEMLIVFAAGNNGRDDDKDGRIDANSVSSPGTAKNALTVGASENYLLKGGIQRPLRDLMQGKPWSAEPLASDTLSNDPNGVAAFSSVGPTNDGRRKPDIVAPGTNIVSNCSHINGASPLWGNYNKDYCYSGGTSMSTPLTAGAAAVAREFLAKKGAQDPSAALVKGLLLHTAHDMYPGQYGEVGRSRGQELLSPGPNPSQGYGRVDMARLTEGSAGDFFIDEKDGVAVGKNVEVLVKNSGYKTFVATLVYTDYPGAPSASKTMVNDIDLVVIDSAGREYHNRSSVNNNEQVIVKNLPAGDVQIRIEGINVPQGNGGKQPFALLMSGR